MHEIKISSHALNQLYKEIGQEPGLQKILSQFYQTMSKDIIIGYFFNGKDIESIAQMQKSFLLRAWGITQSYTGKSPATAHANLPTILRGHFDRRLVILRETLENFKIDPQWIELWIDFENKFRNAIESKS